MMIMAFLLLATSHLWQPAVQNLSLERRLAEYINSERRADGLPPIALSRALTRVARAHVQDLMVNRPDRGSDGYGRQCTMHSWSDAGSWTPVCYTADHAFAHSMWSKPREITHGFYQENGFEIAYRMPGGVTPEVAIDGWLGSSPHAAVILEEGRWHSANWLAMGVAIYGEYAVAWFGKEPDSTP